MVVANAWLLSESMKRKVTAVDCNIVFYVLLLLGYIDLSKRRVSSEEIQKCEEKFSKAKTVSEATPTPFGI